MSIRRRAAAIKLTQKKLRRALERKMSRSSDLPQAFHGTGNLPVGRSDVDARAGRDYICPLGAIAPLSRKGFLMRPYIICHMLSSLDGKINSDALSEVMDARDYEATGAELQGDAWICGRTTMQEHFADREPFVAQTKTPAGPRPVFVARKAESYAVAVDTLGKLQWSEDEIDGDHLICVVSERVPEDYLTMLQNRKISYVVSGKSTVDLAAAVDRLGKDFGIGTLLLEGGGNINGAFLQADLVDEISLIIVPGIDGRHDIPAVFDGLSPDRGSAVPLKLKSVERRERDALWLRYAVVRAAATARDESAKA